MSSSLQQLDCYKIEVLYLLNPHLIWVQVRDPAIVFDDNEIKFEQIGIYGLLPLETTIALDEEEISVQRCEKWVPAAAARIWEFLDDEDVFFIPIHLDRRSSIFDDNVHKFGDLVVKKRNGKTRSLTKVLKNTGFASYDICGFHQYLSLGKINTKLSNIETLNVIKQLEKYFITKNVPKNIWEDPIKHQTSLFRVTCDLEEALTTTNVDKHNKNVKAILDNKTKDLELCKGVDEPSVGRGSTRRGKEKRKNALEKRLELTKRRKSKYDSIDSVTTENKNNDHSQAFEDTKMFLEANAAPYSKKICSKTDAQKAQILNKVMSKSAKKVSKQEKLVNRLLNESREKRERNKSDNVVEKPLNRTDESHSNSVLNTSTILSHTSKQEDILNKDKNVEETFNVADVKELLESVQLATTISKPVENLLDNNDNHIVNLAESQKYENNENSSNKSEQELSVKIEEPVVGSTLKEEQVISNGSNNVDYRRHRQSKRGKSNKKGAKALKLEPQESTSQTKNGAPNHPMSPLHKRAYSTRIIIGDADPNNYRKILELPDDPAELLASPISEEMVKKLMSTFKLSGSKHTKMIECAVRKYKEGGNYSNSEAIAALQECRNLISQNKVGDDLKNNEDPKKFVINVDVPLMQTLSKKKLKKQAKKHNVNIKRTSVAYGPPGIDISTLSRVPAVILCDEENSNNENKTDAVISNRGTRKSDEDFIDPGPSCSYGNKTPENGGGQHKEIKNKRNDSTHLKDTSSSSSSMWEKRLKLHKEMARNKRCSSYTSDTTNKDSSNLEEKSPPKNFTKQNVDEDSDDSISDIVKKIGIGLNSHAPSTCKHNNTFEYIPSERIVNANPFQNYDESFSVFVDKLVTPIMLVHSKMNKCFVPTCRFRDINFSDHIRSTLKSIHINKPMMVQTISWNAILRGYSVFMIGSTLSGKTMGYLPAVCRHVMDFHQSESICDGVGPFCIIVCATSYSVDDIKFRAKLLLGCEEKIVSCHYGYDEVAIATSLLNGCDLLITTAPCLVRLLQMANHRLDLQRLMTFVLDDCERLSEVYANEIKFCLLKVREMHKSRVNKRISVQYIVASRIWCEFMEVFAKKAPDAVLCIGAFQECVLYAKANMSVTYVKKDGKLPRLLEFLKDVDPSKRTVIVCDSDEEVFYLSTAIYSSKIFTFASYSTMTVQDLYNLTVVWKEFREPMMAPVLICLDANLYHMNVVDATYLVHYSMPSLYSTFCRRFATLNESYPSIFKANNNSKIKILVLLDEYNVEQLPKIINFVKRCTNNVPDCLDGICAAVMTQKDVKKAENCAPLCENLMSCGVCPDLYYCHSRHTILKDYDEPKEWMPKSGIVTFKILHYRTATCYSARLIESFDAGTHFKFPSTYSHMSLTMGMHYAKQTNRIAFGIPKVGDVCAVAFGHNLFCRAKVLKVGDQYEKGNVRPVLVNLLDTEQIEATTDTNLYHLPDDFKREETYVVQVRLANIKPRDKDLVFSQLATEELKEAISSKKNVYMKGRIIWTVGNCIFVDTLEACQDLKSLKQTVVIYNVKSELLEKHAENNPDHLPKIEDLCRKAELEVKPAETKENEFKDLIKVKSKIRWAHFEENIAMVVFGAVENPTTLFVRRTKFEDCLKNLLSDIQKYVANNTARFEEFEKGDIVLAEYPIDCLYERARIDEIGDKHIKCFFVDQGEWHQITKDKITSISEPLISQLPFQAIECRLVGIQPVGDQWTDFASNWLFDRSSESATGASKQLYVMYCTKEPAQYTEGHKYGVIVFDTSGNEDLILNQLMIQLNLAKEISDEIKYIQLDKCTNECEATCKEVVHGDDIWEDVSKNATNCDSSPINAIPQPIRSVPLVGTDDDSDGSGQWNINMTEDMAGMFKPLIEASTQVVKTNVPAIENNKVEITEEIDKVSLSDHINKCTSQVQEVKLNIDSSKELDSDDLSSPEARSLTEISGKDEELMPLNEYQMRKPKLNWRQTKSNVAIKILLVGADDYDLQIQDRALTFAATVNDTNFGFEFELYGVIDKKTALHSNKGQYILVKLNKIMHKNWLTLTKDGGIRKWIVYDVDSIDTSSSEDEEVQKDNLFNIVKNLEDNSDTDSDEDIDHGAVDDVNFKYKNHD